MDGSITKSLSSAEMAILNNRIEGICRKMANTLLRTGRSGVINRARDFSISVVTRDSRLLSSAEGLPIHVLVGADIMSHWMHTYHPDLKPGDAFLNNSPYHGNSHAGDYSVLVPVFDNDGVHHMTVLSKSHMADIGNSRPVTLFHSAKDVYEEGALIFPGVRVERNYEPDQDFQRMCEMRIRAPEQWRGDFLAIMAAARIGEREFHTLAAEVGWETIHQFEEQWFDYSEQRMAKALQRLPSKRASVSTHADHFPGFPPDGLTITAHVECKPDEGRIEVDLRDNPDCVDSGMNVSQACALTAAMVGIFNSIDHSVPKNAGSFRRIKTYLRDGCCIGGAPHPYSCSVSTTGLADRSANCVQRAIAEMVDGQGMAESGYSTSPSVGMISGIYPETKKPFVDMVFLGFSGGGASAQGDAWFSTLHTGNGGMCYQDSVELDELYLPLHVATRRVVQDTEGAGKFRGASSLLVEYGPVDTWMDIGFGTDGRLNPPQGVRGGGPGAGSQQGKRTQGGTYQTLPNFGLFRIQSGEQIVARYCGGGGYGSPLERDPAAVAYDVAEGFVSVERAKAVYGVVCNEAGIVDLGATEAARTCGTRN